MTNEEIADIIIDYQGRLYDKHNWDSAPFERDEYERGVDEIAEMMKTDDIGNLITKEALAIVENENAHMAYEAAEKISGLSVY